jgi:peptidoglycan/xylan/chitin deacetylase (PgdA/CDA1 family)
MQNAIPSTQSVGNAGHPLPFKGTNKGAKRYAVLSMDVEDWYHLDYFNREQCLTSSSLLDGLDRYLEILAREEIPSSFFVLGELAHTVVDRLRSQPDIGVHGWSHRRPLTLSEQEFAGEINRTKQVLEEALGRAVEGHRAPCFSIDRTRLEIVKTAGFTYDSSRIQFSSHPLYGTLDMSGFNAVRPWIFERDGFFEFEVSTVHYLRTTVPISGGGYLRLLPWTLMRHMLRRYLKQESLFVLYIHPFELSRKADPPLPAETRWPSRVRFSRGRGSTEQRLLKLIALLREFGFTFATFADVRKAMMHSDSGSRTSGVS